MEDVNKNISNYRGSEYSCKASSTGIKTLRPFFTTKTFSGEWISPNSTAARRFRFTGMTSSSHSWPERDGTELDVPDEQENSTVLASLINSTVNRDTVPGAGSAEQDQANTKALKLCTLLESMIAELKSELAALKNGRERIELLESAVAGLKDDKLALSGEITRLQQELADRDEKAREREERIEKLEKKVKNLSTPRMQRFKKNLHKKLVDSLKEQESGERKQEG